MQIHKQIDSVLQKYSKPNEILDGLKKITQSKDFLLSSNIQKQHSLSEIFNTAVQKSSECSDFNDFCDYLIFSKNLQPNLDLDVNSSCLISFLNYCDESLVCKFIEQKLSKKNLQYSLEQFVPVLINSIKPDVSVSKILSNIININYNLDILAPTDLNALPFVNCVKTAYKKDYLETIKTLTKEFGVEQILKDEYFDIAFENCSTSIIKNYESQILNFDERIKKSIGAPLDEIISIRAISFSFSNSNAEEYLNYLIFEKNITLSDMEPFVLKFKNIAEKFQLLESFEKKLSPILNKIKIKESHDNITKKIDAIPTTNTINKSKI